MASRARQLSKLLSSDLLTVDVNNSRIGVNSTAPEETLDVRDSLTVGFDTSTTGRDLHVYSDLGTPVRIETTKTTSNIEFMDSETSSTFNVKVGSVGDNLALKSQSDTTFLTGSGAGTEKMRITGVGGSVGIGTDEPIARLTIGSTAGDGPRDREIRIDASQHASGGTNAYGMFRIYGDSGSSGKYVIGYNTSHTSQADQFAFKNADGPITFFAGATNSNTEKVRISAGGSFGIGTTEPANRLHIRGSHTQPQIKIEDSESDNHAQISVDGVNDTLNFDWVSNVKRDIHFLNTGYTTAGGQGGIAVGVGTTNGRRIAGFTINADGGNANSHTGFAVKAFQNNNFLRFAREGTTADGNITISNNYERTGGSEYTPDNVNIDRTCITFHRSNGLLFRHSTQDGSATYSSAPTIRLTVDENGIDVNGSISKDSGSFRIPHPLAGLSTTNDLVHSFVEAPDASNLYAGMVDLVDGTATVNIDTAHRMTEGTFVALNHVQSWSSSNESGYSPVKCSISGNLLTIECQDTSSTDTVYYEVRGIRKDQHMLDTHWTDENGRVITEPLKKVVVDDD